MPDVRCPQLNRAGRTAEEADLSWRRDHGLIVEIDGGDVPRYDAGEDARNDPRREERVGMSTVRRRDSASAVTSSRTSCSPLASRHVAGVAPYRSDSSTFAAASGLSRRASAGAQQQAQVALRAQPAARA